MPLNTMFQFFGLPFCLIILLVSAFSMSGLPEPKVVPMFKGLTTGNGFYTSKDFLPVVCAASKPGMKV